jgi:hypothetical protein
MKELGVGSHGAVFLVMDREIKEIVALKLVRDIVIT